MSKDNTTPEIGNSVRKIGEIAQVRTLADGGIRVIIDLPEDAIEFAAWCMLVRQQGRAVCVELSLDNKRTPEKPTGVVDY